MKKLFYFAIMAVMASVLTSCHSVYSLKSLNVNYAYQMDSEKEAEIRDKIYIFNNEKDIKGEYDILSINAYYPSWICQPMSIFHSAYEKKIRKKFYAEAVKKTFEEGGNAVLIVAPGYFKVLDVTKWDAEPENKFNNPIFDTEAMDRVKNGNLRKQKRAVRVRAESALIDDIDANISFAHTLDETKMIREKIKVLSDYNLQKPSASLTKKINKFGKKVNSKEKSIKRKMAKKAKTAKK